MLCRCSLRSIVIVQILTMVRWFVIVIGTSSGHFEINNNDIDIISADDILNPAFMPTSWLIWDDNDYRQRSSHGQPTESLMMRSDESAEQAFVADAIQQTNGSFGRALNTMGFHRYMFYELGVKALQICLKVGFRTFSGE